MDAVVFVISAAIVLGGGLGVVMQSNPVHAALSLIASFFGVAVLFVLQEAHFLALVQVVVYGGAIVVLFLFVIMLLGVDRFEDLRIEPLANQRVLAGVAVHFVAMEAQFLAAVQVIVYAGAIVVLFLFVIMLLGVDNTEQLRTDPIPIQRPLAAVMGVGLVGLLIAACRGS